MKVANVVFGSARARSVGSPKSGRRSFHIGLILILPSSSSYLRRPWSERNFESLVSLLVPSPSSLDSSSTLCHSPSFMIEKNLSRLKHNRRAS